MDMKTKPRAAGHSQTLQVPPNSELEVNREPRLPGIEGVRRLAEAGQRGLGDDATDEVVAQILTITGGVHRQVDLIIPRILDLKERNRRKLAGGEVTMREIVAMAGTKIMTSAL